MINSKLKQYIEKNIFPEYQKNEEGHGLKHIKYVIRRSLNFANTLDNINLDMVYTIAAYHDIGHHIDAKNHEKISSEILLADKNLKDFFDNSQIQTMAEAVADHRSTSSKEPRNIYGKIVSSADKNTSTIAAMTRTYSYTKKHNPHLSLDELIEESRLHIKKKFGKNGYAKSKMYFKDEEFDKFLDEAERITSNVSEFRKKYCEINHINEI